jgi:carbon monoxide dehydrogenase subunit G
MLIEGEFRVAASLERAWTELADVGGLASLLPGCEVLEPEGEGRYHVVARAKVGPIASRFEGRLSVLETIAGETLRFRVEGQDRLTGSRARALMGFRLVPVSAHETEVRHSADVIVSGRLGAIGQGVMQRTIATMVEEFIRRLNARIAAVPANGAGSGEA